MSETSGKTHLDYCPGCKGPHRPLRMIIVSGKPRSDQDVSEDGGTDEQLREITR